LSLIDFSDPDVFTIAVNRHGATCGPPFRHTTVTTTHTITRHATTTTTPTPHPTQLAACAADTCPSLDRQRCIDDGNVQYKIRCGKSIEGLEMFFPSYPKQKRAYVADFADCLAHCDPGFGCAAASYDPAYNSCRLYGSVVRFLDDDEGVIAAKRLTYPPDDCGSIVPVTSVSSHWVGLGGTAMSSAPTPGVNATWAGVRPSMTLS
jgi:hypothetical protein